MKPALLVMDMQKAYLDLPFCKSSIEMATPFVSAAVELFHRARHPVFFAQHKAAGSGPGSRGFELIAGLDPAKEDVSITKSHGNAFQKTDFETELQARSSSIIIICGFSAGHGIGATYFAAKERGFKAAILQDAIAGWKQSYIEITRELPLVSLEVLEAAM